MPPVIILVHSAGVRKRQALNICIVFYFLYNLVFFRLIYAFKVVTRFYFYRELLPRAVV